MWPTLGQAVWALRGATSYPQVLRRVIDLGGDTDTVAAVAGGLAGAVFSTDGIPDRWRAVLHGRVPGFGDHRWTAPDLTTLASTLAAG
ncbi:unannotated protein [freshwater metagenome]|uniref:Unannotated protein n=1 Tax=freshwater metagenome TaxID=449393 RepID=A0A6J7H178_9ZZZZ